MRIKRITLLFAVGISILVFTLSHQASNNRALASPLPQSQNLLVNPSFEAPYYEFVIPMVGNGFVAHGWNYWWYKEEGDEYGVPEYKEITADRFPQRVIDGNSAQVYFKKFSAHIAGVYQRVEVPANAQLRFGAWGMAWSTFSEPPVDPYNSYSGDGANPVWKRVGIDPTGGTNPFSSNIIWSDMLGTLDEYQLFEVEATAQGNYVTVYVWSSPQYPAATIDVFWDDASLIAFGQGAESFVPSLGDQDSQQGTPIPTTPSASGFNPLDSTEGVEPVPAQPPREDGSQWHVVQAGDTILRIAVTYNVTAQTIRELNGLSSDTIFPGTELLIKLPLGETEDIEPATADGSTGQDDETVSEGSENTPTKVTQAQICLVLFEDSDGNNIWGQNEALLAGGVLSLSDQKETTYSYTTDGINEPYCFRELRPGNYVVSIEAPETYEITGDNDIQVSLAQDEQIALSIGASVPANSSNTEDTSKGVAGVFMLIILGIGLIAAGAGGTYFLMDRGKQSGSINSKTEENVQIETDDA